MSLCVLEGHALGCDEVANLVLYALEGGGRVLQADVLPNALVPVGVEGIVAEECSGGAGEGWNDAFFLLVGAQYNVGAGPTSPRFRGSTKGPNAEAVR